MKVTVSALNVYMHVLVVLSLVLRIPVSVHYWLFYVYSIILCWSLSMICPYVCLDLSFHSMCALILFCCLHVSLFHYIFHAYLLYLNVVGPKSNLCLFSYLSPRLCIPSLSASGLSGFLSLRGSPVWWSRVLFILFREFCYSRLPPPCLPPSPPVAAFLTAGALVLILLGALPHHPTTFLLVFMPRPYAFLFLVILSVSPPSPILSTLMSSLYIFDSFRGSRSSSLPV